MDLQNQEMVNTVAKNFPWVASLIASVISTVFLMGISILFFGGYKKKPQKGGIFKIIMVGVFIISTVAVIPKMPDNSFESIQFMILNFFFIFGMAVLLYETLGTMLIEKYLIPRVLALFGITYTDDENAIIKITKVDK